MGETRSSKVLVLSTVHAAGDTRIFVKQAMSLADNGFQVEVVFWGDGDSEIVEDYENGLRKIVFPRPNSGSSLLKRIKTIWHALKYGMASDADVIIVHDPELIPVGVFLEGEGKRVVYDAHEDLPAQFLHKKHLPIWMRFFGRWMSFLFVFAADKILSGTLCATPTIQERYRRRSCLVRNYPRLDEIEFKEGRQDDAFEKVVYIGALSEARGILELVEAISEVDTDCRLTLAGKWERDSFRQKCEAADTRGRVDYVGVLERGAVANTLAESGLGIVVLQSSPAYMEALPVKLFEYMASGLPVIASDFPIWREIVDGADCGLLVEPGQISQLAGAIDEVLGDLEAARKMGENGRKAVEEQYCWAQEEKGFVAFVSGIAGLN